jgi:hypothetical protein
MEGMTSLSNYKNLEFFQDKTPEGLKAQMAQIRLPFEIVSLYYANGNHVAWLNLSRKVKKQEKSNGSSKGPQIAGSTI